AAVASGHHAAGFLAYEAAPAFDPAMVTHPPGTFPVLWFGIYERVSVLDDSVSSSGGAYTLGDWSAAVSKHEYVSALAEIRERIAAGETYQVNYTYPIRASFHGDSVAWFQDMAAAQQADFTAYLDLGRHKILSASPELFFRLDGNELRCRPMKGTCARGLWYEDDCDRATALRVSEKERAENLMIVDLLRNDMGRVSTPGSIRVEELFNLERYPTVWQMTSSIVSHTDASLPEIFAALFPSGSVTGAPKIQTMGIIRTLENGPRNVYCGTIGWWDPCRQAEFNVAIRTATVDTQTHEACYPVGGGITWDSVAENEYAESRLKMAVLSYRTEPFELLETLLWDGEYFLLDRHLRRLRESAIYFGFSIDADAIARALREKARQFGTAATRVRLLVSRKGFVQIESEVVTPWSPRRIGLADRPVDSGDPFLYHKTTRRSLYESHRASRPELDDVILWNRNGELTESTLANLVVELDGRLLTPPVSCGLLPGVMRGLLLDEGEIEEGIVTKADLARAGSVRLVNSVRKWIDISLIDNVFAPQTASSAVLP
ncbi:MAG: aminodeoxychorismate synthase component I, partial [Candidatus Hydrogenedentes bacterium]|nr:aminodeoxychorismate synthase component I [Candidatus Hydrogenedentota bacterium]